MGCITSKKDHYPKVFQVMNVDEHGNHIHSGQLEITDLDLVLHQEGKSPIKWPLKTLRRYGFDAEHFSFESGRRCPTGPGIYAFRCKKAEQLFNLLQNRIQTTNNEDGEISRDGTLNIVNSTSSDSVYLEPASVRGPTAGSRFSSQNGEVARLNSVRSASGNVGPLPPQSITSIPLTLVAVPVTSPLPTNHPLSQNLYVNEEVIAAAAQDLEETNNNKTLEEPVFPSVEHSYLNSAVLENLPKEDFVNPVNRNHHTTDKVSSLVVDTNHFYVNIGPGTDQITPCIVNVEAESSSDFVTLKWEKTEDSLPNNENFEANISLAQKPENANSAAPPTKKINYIVLDLEPSKDSPKSQTGSTSPNIPQTPTGGYAAIDFKKTAALSHSINPNFDTDNESCRKTRHSSNINNGLTHERHNFSVND